MSADDLSPVIPPDFDGEVRLFPLPTVVFFPHVILPLHIFEPRYCDLLEDALQTDRLIAMSLLMPGWEHDSGLRPSIAPVACLGKIVSHSRLPDGRHNILLAGVRRAAIAKELPLHRSYRRAQAELLEDFYPASGAGTRPRIQRELLECFHQFIPKSTLAGDQFEQMLTQQMSLGMLTDIIAYTINLPLPQKQQLLNEWQVDRRAALLLTQLEQLLGKPTSSSLSRPFPPTFSQN